MARVYAQKDREADGKRTGFERAAEWRQARFVKSLEDLNETVEKAIDSVAEYGFDLSTDELDSVREHLKRANRRADEQEAFTDDDDDGGHFFRRERDDRESKT